MTRTATQLIYRALRLIGQFGAGFGAAPEALTDGLDALNMCLETWGTDRLFAFTITDQLFTFSTFKQSYSIGPSGADFTAPRPVKIESANILLTATNVGAPTRSPLNILSSQEWSQILVPSISSPIPLGMYCDYQTPNANLYFYPEPSAANKLELFTWAPLQQFGDLVTAYSLPPGYAEALSYALAVRLAPTFPKGEKKLYAEVARMAISLENAIRANNAPSPDMWCDAPGCGRGASFNWITGMPI